MDIADSSVESCNASKAFEVQLWTFVNPDESPEAHTASFEFITQRVVGTDAANEITNTTTAERTVVPLYSMQDMIELLGSYLTSEEDKYRNRATTLLADLLHKKRFTFNPTELHLFVVFFTHRLTDYPSIIPSLQALIALTHTYGDVFDGRFGDALDILQTIFSQVHVPSYAQNIRQKVFELYHVMLDNKHIVEGLEAYGEEVLEGLVGSMEEEKDPRCLLLALQIISTAMELFPDALIGAAGASNSHELSPRLLGQQVVDSGAKHPIRVQQQAQLERRLQVRSLPDICIKIFESTSCYFPITFSPPPDDPFGITPESLIAALEDCLCSQPLIASALSVPFFIEQSSQDLKEARIHAVRGIARIVRSFSHRALYFFQRTSQQQQLPSSLSSSSLVRSNRDNDAEGDDDYDDDNDGMGGTYDSDNDVDAYANEGKEKAKYRFLDQMSENLYDMAVEESSTDFVAGALVLIGEITKSIGMDMSGKYAADWQHFSTTILNKVRTEVSTGSTGSGSADLASLRTKSALDVALVMARLGGCMSSAAVMNFLIDPLLDHIKLSQELTQGQIVRAVHACVYRGVDKLNVLSEKMPASGGGGVADPLATASVAVEMLSQLVLACSNSAVGASLNLHTSAATATTTALNDAPADADGDMDIDEADNGNKTSSNRSDSGTGVSFVKLGALDALYPHALRILFAAAAFVQPLVGKVFDAASHAAVAATEAAPGAAAQCSSDSATATATAVVVNPFLAVKQEHGIAIKKSDDPAIDSATATETTSSDESRLGNTAVAVAKEFHLEPGVSACIASAISLIKDLLISVDASAVLSNASLDPIISTISDISVNGLDALWSARIDKNSYYVSTDVSGHAAGAASTLASASVSLSKVGAAAELPVRCTVSEKAHAPVREAARACLVALSRNHNFLSLINSCCVVPFFKTLTLLQNADSAAGSDDVCKDERRVHQVLTAVAQQVEDISLLESLTPLLLHSIEASAQDLQMAGRSMSATTTSAGVAGVCSWKQPILRLETAWATLQSLLQPTETTQSASAAVSSGSRSGSITVGCGLEEMVKGNFEKACYLTSAVSQPNNLTVLSIIKSSSSPLHFALTSSIRAIAVLLDSIPEEQRLDAASASHGGWRCITNTVGCMYSTMRRAVAALELASDNGSSSDRAVGTASTDLQSGVVGSLLANLLRELGATSTPARTPASSTLVTKDDGSSPCRNQLIIGVAVNVLLYLRKDSVLLSAPFASSRSSTSSTPVASVATVPTALEESLLLDWAHAALHTLHLDLLLDPDLENSHPHESISNDPTTQVSQQRKQQSTAQQLALATEAEGLEVKLGDYGPAQLVAVIANKMPPGVPLQELLETTISLVSYFEDPDSYSASSSNAAVAPSAAAAAADVLLWTARAVLMRPNVRYEPSKAALSKPSATAGSTSHGSAFIQRLLSSVSPGASASTWQDMFNVVLVQVLSLLSFNTLTVATLSTPFSIYLAAGTSVLTRDHPIVLPAATANTTTLSPCASSVLLNSAWNRGMFWKQKLWSKLSAPLFAAALHSIRRDDNLGSGSTTTPALVPAQAPTASMLALCSLASGVPLSMLSAELLEQLTEVVVHALAVDTQRNNLTTPQPSQPSQPAQPAQPAQPVQSLKQHTHYAETITSAADLLATQSFDTLEVLLKHDATVFVPYLNVVIPALIQSSQHGASARVRASALEGLLAITEHVPFPRLYPFKRQVENGLRKSLDDRKRAVRYLAGRVRNKWLIMK